MGTWHGDPDDAAARFLAEHGGVSRMDDDEHVIEFGNEALLPPWPPMDIRKASIPAEGEEPDRRVKLPGGPIRSDEVALPGLTDGGSSAGPATGPSTVYVARTTPNVSDSAKKPEKSSEGVEVSRSVPRDLLAETGAVRTPSSSPERAGTTPAVDEQVPCPTCWLPADLIGPTDIDVLHHSLCPRGHDNTLAPVVLAHLRTL